MPGDTIGIGFVGYGWIARAHAHALHTLNHLRPLAKRIRLVTMAGRHADGVAAAAGELGFERWTTSWEELVEDPEVDVLANVSALEVHAAPSIAALELGKPVLCEKPLGADAAESGRMLAAAEEAGVTHACGFNYRFVPAVRLAYETIAAGRLGEPRHFRFLYLQDWKTAGDQPRLSLDAGAVRDYAHLADLLFHFGAEPLSVSATTSRFVSEAEDAYTAAFELAGGAAATLEASRCATGWKGRQRLEVNGSEGSLWWDMEDVNRLHVFFVQDEREGLGGFRDVLVTQPDHPFLAGWWTPGHVLGWEASFVNQWREFLQAVLEERPVPNTQASFEDGYRAAVLCEAILESGKEGRRIEVSARQGTAR